MDKQGGMIADRLECVKYALGQTGLAKILVNVFV